MTAHTTFFRRAGAAALFAMVLAAPGSAQANSAGNPEADALSARAQTLYSSPTRYAEAAAVHVRAASLRSVDDPRRADDLVAAARLFVYAGDLETGRSTFEKAAQTALVAGDLAFAGHRYIDAAFIAAKASDTEGARRMLGAARWIADAPMLQPAVQRELRRRFAAEDLD